MPEFAWTNTEHGFEEEPSTPESSDVVGVISPPEPVQLDDEVSFEDAVITSLNAVHDRLDALGTQNDWLVDATKLVHANGAWIRQTFEQLMTGLLASPMGAMIKSKMPPMGGKP